jgi:hypothetical protein
MIVIVHLLVIIKIINDAREKVKGTAVPLEWPRGFQEVKVPRFHENGTGWW